MLVLALLSIAPPQDTVPFADSATRVLVARAMERHRQSDRAVRDYTARLRYQFSFGLGRRRWARIPAAAVEEQDARVEWAWPNDLRVEILGRRARARSEGLEPVSVFDRPWFVPRGLGDSVRLFGNDFPGQAAIHPLAAGAAQFYRYRLRDSVRLATPDGRSIRLLGVEVLPRRAGRLLTAGRIWLDAATADVVRFSFRFVGTDLWVVPDQPTRSDSADARRANRLISRVLRLDVDLEYSLQDERYWMPYRQTVAGRVELPWFGELVVPLQAVTTFDDYAINTGRPVMFRVPLPPPDLSPDSVRARERARRDSLRSEARRVAGGRRWGEDLPRDDAGWWPEGRYEIHRPPADSLRAYQGWGEPLALESNPAEDLRLRELAADLERMTVTLPVEYTGRPRQSLFWERLGEAVRFNRVQGQTLGLGYRWTLPGDGFTTVGAVARYGWSDSRITGTASLIREAPGDRWSLHGFREVRSNDPAARGGSWGNSLNAIFAGHDDADYLLAQGGAVVREAALGYGIELVTAFRVEKETSVRREARSWINDVLGGSGRLPPNRPIREGTYAGLSTVLEGGMFRAGWRLGADVLGNDAVIVGRLHGMLRRTVGSGGLAPRLTLRAGIATSADLPQQMFRIGGQGTVRGFDYGTRRGRACWSAQVDWPVTRGLIRPVLFADAGQAGRPASLLDTRLLAGAGAGVSVLGGLLRADLSHPLTGGSRGLRFDLSAGLF